MRSRQVRVTVGPAVLACLLAVTIMPTMAKGLLRRAKVDPLAVPEAVARYELGEYRKLHPKAELIPVFFNHQFANADQAELRRRLGFSKQINPATEVLTLQFDHVQRDDRKLDVSVLYGNPGRGGFRAHYAIKKYGKKLVVADRNVFLRY